MRDELLSIIIPVYNCEKYISRCIESVIKQQYKNIEIIIIDDGSTDKTYSLCQKYANIDNRITLIKKKNTGVSDSRNVGIEKAKGEYITFIDADDWVDDDCYSNLISNLENYNADISIGNYCLEYESNSKKDEFEQKQEIKELNQKEFLEGLFKENWYRGFLWNKIYKRKIFNYKLNTEIYMCEDLLANVHISKNIEKAVYTTKKMYHYFQRDGSSMNSNINLSEVTVMYAYKEIMELVKDMNIENIEEVQKTLLIHALKCKIILEQFKKEEDDVYKYCNEIIKKYYNHNILKCMSKKQRIKTIILKRIGKIYVVFRGRRNKK